MILVVFRRKRLPKKLVLLILSISVTYVISDKVWLTFSFKRDFKAITGRKFPDQNWKSK